MLEAADELKDVQLKAMVTASQKRQWERAARKARRTLSDWIRVTLDDAAADVLSENEPPPKKPRKKRGR